MTTHLSSLSTLTGFFTLTQRAIAEMLKRSGGHILVNLCAALS
jgi:hypothetical protein